MRERKQKEMKTGLDKNVNDRGGFKSVPPYSISTDSGLSHLMSKFIYDAWGAREQLTDCSDSPLTVLKIFPAGARNVKLSRSRG